MKKILALFLAMSMFFALAACGNNNANDPDSSPSLGAEQESQAALESKENIDNTYIRPAVSVAWKSVTSLTPWSTANDTPGNYEVYEMLYECDANGDMYPLLADGTYEGSYMAGCDHEDGTGVYTVKIYDCIYDHNNNHITASDVAYSYMYQYENETTAGWQDLINVEAKDDTTVVFTFTEDQNGVGEFLNIFARCFIVSEKAHSESKSGFASDMCGTGPYMLKEFTPGSELTIERYEDYWQLKAGMTPRQEQQANVQEITYKFIDEAAQRVVALQTGVVDFVHELEPASTPDFADGGAYSDQYNVYQYAAKFIYYMPANCSGESIMSDINMRLAVFNAIDQDGLIIAMGGTETRVCGLVSYYGAFYDADWVDYAAMDNYNTRTSVDQTVVDHYLELAGYKGETLKLLVPGGYAAPEILSAQLNAAGIKCEVSTVDFSTYQTTLGDPTAWDLTFGGMAGSEMATVWLHAYSYSNTPDGDRSMFFSVDQEWEDLLNEIQTEAGHTPENMQAWWEHCVENAYCMGLYNATSFEVVPEDMTYVCLGDKLTPLPGACTYAAPEA